MKRIIVVLILLLTSHVAFSQTVLENYRLGPGDGIKISVFGQADLLVETRVPATGVINYPFIGDIVITGVTASELESLIYAGLKGDYLVEPSVSVSVTEYRPFFIDGEVKRPGGYPYQPNLTIDKAAALAGGYTERASKNKVVILREVDGQQVTIDADTNDPVFPGDIVTIQQSFF